MTLIWPLTIVHQQSIAPQIFELTLKGDLAKTPVSAGQFVMLKLPDPSLLLNRPFGVAAVNPKRQTLTLIYRVVGAGTKLLSQLRPGTILNVTGYLGQGFPTTFLKPKQRVLIIGGGTGIPPLYALSRQLVQKQVVVQHVFGFATARQQFYLSHFKTLGSVALATDDGTSGFKGHVGLLLDRHFMTQSFDAVYACGPRGLLIAVDNRFAHHPHAYVSLEAKMACGIGACYACVTRHKTQPSQNYKICETGPVFATNEVFI